MRPIGHESLPADVAVCVAFRKAYLGVRLTLDIANTPEIQRRLHAGEIDVALTEGDADETLFDVTTFLTDDLIAIAGPQHALASKKKVLAATVCAEPFVVREEGSGTRTVVDHALAAKGLSISPVMSAGSTIVIKRAVAAGVGLAFVSRLACELELRSGTLVELHLADLKIARPLHRLRLRGRHEGRAVAEFDRLLKEEVEILSRKPGRGRKKSSGLIEDHTAASMR